MAPWTGKLSGHPCLQKNTSSPMSLTTPHLHLIPYAPQHLLALIDGVAPFEASIGLRAAEGLRDFIVSKEVSPAWLAQLRAATESDPWKHGFAVVDLDSGAVIGNASFTGPPDAEGTVEIAYGIVPAYQGRGYAIETTRALVAFARASGQVRRIRAHTLPELGTSARVLTRCGFRQMGELTDPEGLRVWRWELPEAPGA